MPVRVMSACRLGAGFVAFLAACGSCSSSDGGSGPATLTGISVAPTTASLGQGFNRQLVATASYSDGSNQIKTAQASWTSTANGVATVSAGLVTGVSVGTAEIIASLSGIADTSEVTVTSAVPTQTGVVVTPAAVTIAVNATTALVATATYDDASSKTVTGAATWSSTATAVATVATGVVTGVGAGTAGIIASSNGFADTTQVTVSASSAPPPLTVAAGGRYLVDQSGKPFFLVGDAAWSLISQLSDGDADTYLASRQQHGFNLAMVNLIEHKFADNAPNDIYNISPFTGVAFKSAPNEAYFAHADYIIQSAAQKGIFVLLAPAYLGYSGLDEGWRSELTAATNQNMTDWGAYVGARYKNYDNIIWLIGGDATPNATEKQRLQAVVNGIQSADTRHLFSAHNEPESMAIDPWSGAAWLAVNNIYTRDPMYEMALTAYHVAPAKPFFLIEARYDGEGANDQELRAQSYWTVLSGGFGHVYGDCPIWPFSASAASGFCNGAWQGELNNQGALNMQYLAKLFNARHWHLLVPDEANAAIPAGDKGTFGSTSYVTAATASDGSSIIAYLPTARAVTVNAGVLTGASNVTAWWYDPSNGASTPTNPATFTTSAPQTLAAPPSGDWVLVVDNNSFGFPAP